MTIRVLCAGDIHIGRQLSRVEGTFRTKDAWDAIVNLAIDEQFDLVALSGDLIDNANASYEALGSMQHGLARLDSAQIQTVAVAGNHDHHVLARLAANVGTGRFHFLGRGGEWERFTLSRDGAPILHVDGWSFPSEHTSVSPLQHYVLQARDTIPVMGVLHGEVGVPLSTYAPIALADLWAHGFDFLLLGHIHAPRVFDGPGGRRALYPGSPWAMDPGEPGVHGVWMATFDSGQPVRLERIAISPVRYDAAEIDFSDIEDEQDFEGRLLETLRTVGQKATAEHGNDCLRTISLRLLCNGESTAHRVIPAWIAAVLNGPRSYPVGSTIIEIDTVVSVVRPPVDLETLSQGTDPLAETAKLILALRQVQPPAKYHDLIRSMLRDMVEIHDRPNYASLGRRSDGVGEPTETDARSLLTARAWVMLSSLSAQKESV